MKFNHDRICQLDSSEIISIAKGLSGYIKRLARINQSNDYDTPESSILLPHNDDIRKEVLGLAGKLKNDKLKFVIDIGIGGSNLGAKAVYDALLGYSDQFSNRYPKMIFLDTNDSEFISSFLEILGRLGSKEEIVINLISKSGSTTETVANFEVVANVVSKKFAGYEDRVVVTTGKDSSLWKFARTNKIHTLQLPDRIGGRYSVFSAVGLFPLSMVGIDIEKLLKGAEDIKDICLSDDPEKNIAAISAAILFLHNKKGRNINDNFFFHTELESTGKWYRQLMGESIGKEHDIDGKKVRSGITPTVSIGSTDLHSMGQLYYGGPLDKVFTLITAPSKNPIVLPDNMQLSSILPHLAGKSAYDVMNAIFKGTAISMEKSKIPFVEVELNGIDEYSLGEFLQFKMIEMMYLANLLNVNAFDQPHVELYKNEMKSILNRS